MYTVLLPLTQCCQRHALGTHRSYARRCNTHKDILKTNFSSQHFDTHTLIKERFQHEISIFAQSSMHPLKKTILCHALKRNISNFTVWTSPHFVKWVSLLCYRGVWNNSSAKVRSGRIHLLGSKGLPILNIPQDGIILQLFKNVD